MDFIVTNVEKMDVLIKGLLRMSRTGRANLNAEKIDMNNLIQTIIEAHLFEIEENDINVRINDLPDCFGDKNLLNQLFSNLLSNSIKYRNKQKN